MKDARKFIVLRMGFSKSSIPGTILPPGEKEGICPLCGRYMRLDSRGYCNTPECNQDARDTIRKVVRDNGGKNIPGLYYKFGSQEIFFFGKLERWEEPKQVKHPDMCSHGECLRWALSADYLCRVHRLEENQAEYKEKKKARGRRKRRTNRSRVGNKIKGLDKIKL